MSLNFTGHLRCEQAATVKVLGVKRDYLGRQIIQLSLSENGGPPQTQELRIGDTLSVNLDLDVKPSGRV